MSTKTYKAFISYSHRDENWAKWLHKALESYKLPRRLRSGSIPERLYPVFRDRDELSSAADLSGKVQDALNDSETLVVICSPSSAKSRWVNEEIRLFRSLGREDRIFCLIVDGDPQSTDPDEACFPPALLETVSGERHEPLAADARPWADGKSLAKLKLVAGILGIRLDELRRREQKRKRKRQMITVIASLAVLALIATAIVSRMAEKARQEHAEALVSQIVEVSKDLNQVADLETLRRIGERLASYLDTLDQENLSDESRMQIALVLRQLGTVSSSQGRSGEAMDAFGRSQDLLASLAKDSPDDLNALFELGQAEYWIGFMHADRGSLDEAEEAFDRYREISQQLFDSDPQNAEWAMEMAYALSNLSMIESRRTPVDAERVLIYIQSAMEFNQNAVNLAPEDDFYRWELAESHAYLADAWLAVCNVGEALANRIQNASFAEKFYQDDLGNNRRKLVFANSLSGLAGTQHLVGMQVQAMDSLNRSVELMSELSRGDQSNLTYRWNLQRKRARTAAFLALEGKEDEAWALSLDIERELQRLEAEDESVGIINTNTYAEFLMQHADLAYRRGDQVLAVKWLNAGIDRLQVVLRDHPDSKEALIKLRSAAFLYWRQNGESLQGNLSLEPFADPSQVKSETSCGDVALAARLSILQGDKSAASDYTAYLLAKGYFEPGFIRFCRQYELCD